MVNAVGSDVTDLPFATAIEVVIAKNLHVKLGVLGSTFFRLCRISHFSADELRRLKIKRSVSLVLLSDPRSLQRSKTMGM